MGDSEPFGRLLMLLNELVLNSLWQKKCRFTYSKEINNAVTQGDESGAVSCFYLKRTIVKLECYVLLNTKNISHITEILAEVMEEDGGKIKGLFLLVLAQVSYERKEAKRKGMQREV